MKRLFVLGLLFSVSVVFASGSCLSGKTSGETISARIVGLFVRNADDSTQTKHRVKIDNQDCTLTNGSGDVTLGSATKSSGYLEFGENADALLAFLINAYNRDQVISFRLWNVSGDGYNQIKFAHFAD